MIAATLGSIVTGLVNVVRAKGNTTRVELRPGDVAPDFELPGSDGCVYRLSQFRGREAVVLAWFPKAFTSGCAAECRSIHASRSALRRFRAQYFGISVDTPETNRRFAGALGIEFPILSDPGGDVARAYGVLGISGVPARWTFYVAVDGRIASIDKRVRVSSHGTDIETTLSDLSTTERA
jgi:peroxiredoxin Q/BCP